MTSLRTYTVGQDFDMYFNNDVPDAYYVALMNPSASDHTITAVLFQNSMVVKVMWTTLVALISFMWVL